MVFDFQHPLALLAILPVAAVLVGIYVKYKGFRAYKGYFPLAVRLTVSILLILSLAGMEIKSLSDDTEIVFVSDLSDSAISNRKDVVEFITSSMKLLPETYQAGIIGFGADAPVEQVISSNRSFYQFHASPNTHYSNIDNALQRAESLFTLKGRKRIILITDGAQNMGDGIMRAKSLGQRGIRVDGVYLDTLPPEEVQLTALDMPATLYQGEDYGVRVEIDSTAHTSGILRLFADRRPAGTLQVEIQKGKNVFLFPQKANHKGTVVYEAELETDIDSFRQNNRMASYIRIEGPPVIALVEGTEGEGRELAKIMEAGGMDYKLFTPYTLPDKLEELVKYDAVILANVDYDGLGKGKVSTLDTYVKSMGKGLLVTGGDSSYALGGWLGTGLEQMLPVDMDLTNKKDIPSLALVLVIDKSGSMADSQYGISKMDLAKEAAIRSVDALKDKDFIGVIGFDSAASWVVDTRKVDDREEIQNTIGTMRPAGGTNLYPGMSLAFESLKKTNAELKHVIVLTDGHTADGNFDGLVKEMAGEGITVSGVAVGRDADASLLERLAEAGNGRYYFTDEFASIPKIFTKETYMASRSYINNETFYPKATGYSPIFADIDSVPPLNGYITTTLKGGADSVLVSNQDDPVFAYWDYGLGKTAAWTSDAKGIWTQDWFNWSKSPEFWLNAISAVLPGGNTDSGKIDVRRDGSKGLLTVSAEDFQSEGSPVSAVIVDPDGKETKVEMQPSRPGYYQAEFELEETGVYLVRAEQKTGDASNVMEAGLVYPYSPEYDIRQTSSKVILEHIVSQTGGRILEKPEDLLKDAMPPVWNHKEIWPLLLLLALILFILDIALRKLGVNTFYNKLLRPAAAVISTGCKKVAALLSALKVKKSEIARNSSKNGKAGDTLRGAEVLNDRNNTQSASMTGKTASGDAGSAVNGSVKDAATKGSTAKGGTSPTKPNAEKSSSADFTSDLLKAKKQKISYGKKPVDRD